MEQCVSLFKLHRLGGFKNRNLFLIILDAETSKVKMPVDSFPGEVTISSLLTPVFFLGLTWQGD